MKEKKIKKRIIFNLACRQAGFALSFCVFLFSFLFFNKTQAARLYFQPQEAVIGSEKEFSVAVNVDAGKSINAIQAVNSVPK